MFTQFFKKPTCVVFGATGQQGGSVIDALLKDKGYRIRAITRNPSSAKAQALAEKHVEVVECNYMVRDQLLKALRGAESVFVVLNTWDGSVKAKEPAIMQLIAECCKESHIRHVVYSSLPTEFKVFDEEGVPATWFKPAIYYQDFYTLFKPETATTHGHPETFHFPEVQELTAFDVRDTGTVVRNVLRHPKQWIGKTVCCTGSNMPLQEYMSCIAANKGKRILLKTIPQSQAIKLMGRELAGMLASINQGGLFGEGADYTSAEKAVQHHLLPFNAYCEEKFTVHGTGAR